MSLISVIDPETGIASLQESNDTVIYHLVDSNGEYMGLMEMQPGSTHVPSPPPGADWFWNDNKWEKKPPTLLELQDAKWEEIKVARAEAIDAPLETPFGVFDCYTQARKDITDSVLLANNLTALSQPVSIDYTLANNTIVVLDGTQMVTVGLILGNKIQTVRAIATNLRVDIYNATTAQELEDIVWPQTI